MKAKSLILLAVIVGLRSSITVNASEDIEMGASEERRIYEEQHIDEMEENGEVSEEVVEIHDSLYTFTKEDEYKDRLGKPVIVDLDFCTDVDDACAIRVAGTLSKRGVIDLKALTFSTNGENDLNLKAANGLLNFQDLGSIPIGRSSVNIPDTSPYWEVCAEYSSSDIQIFDSVTLWRKILVESERPVDIVTTGYLTNLRMMCLSKPDDISDKTGLELIEEKVGNIYVVGGSYPTGIDNNFSFCKEAREATNYCLSTLEDLIIITNDVGGPLLCGVQLQRVDANRHDPLTKALDAFGTVYGRAAWDPFGVYIGAFVNDKETLHNLGLEVMRVNTEYDVETGKNKFTPSPEGRHLRLYRTSNDFNYYNQLMDELCINY